jgi:FkbM family methyltransferase
MLSRPEPFRARADAPFGAHAPSRRLAALLRITRALPDSGSGRRIALAIERATMRRLEGRAVDLEAFGVRFRLHPHDNAFERRILFTPQLFEAEERALLARRIGSGGFVFVDVGCNVGAYSLFVAARAGQRARILAIEPQQALFERFVFNIGANAWGRIKAVACALADRDGEVTLFLDAVNRGESSVKLVRPEERAGGQVSVPARTLLGLMQDEGLERIDALKLHVEGAEDLVLEPFLRAAPAALRPGLIVLGRTPEAWHCDLEALLGEHGYREIARTRTNLVYERRG